MALIDHDESVIFLGELTYLVHGSYIAVHREHAIGSDDAVTLGLCLLKTTLEVGHVGVGITVTLGLAQAHTINNRGMVERVTDDSVFLGEQRLKEATVGVKASGIKDGILGLEII